MEGLTKFLNDRTNQFPDAAGLRLGFSLAYVSLLQSIAKNDMVQLANICEKSLYREFASGLQDINFNYKAIEVLNLSEDDDVNLENVKLSVFGMTSIFGA